MISSVTKEIKYSDKMLMSPQVTGDKISNIATTASSKKLGESIKKSVSQRVECSPNPITSALASSLLSKVSQKEHELQIMQ